MKTKNKFPDAKILVYDLEWRPVKAFVWRAWDENISPDQVIEDGGMLCWSAKWLGSKEVLFSSEWEDGHDDMVRKLHALFCEADALVTYNGDSYDNKKSFGEFLLAGLDPPPPPTSIDVIKTIKKMGYFRAKLSFIGPFLGVGKKVPHEGFSLWKRVMEGDEKAQAKMKRYCLQDTKLLEKLYLRIRPFITNHPKMGNTKSVECGTCGGHHLQSRGFRRTKSFKIKRLQCQDCGSWSDGTRSKV